ncbi:MAG: rod shape-determining protein MreC [Chloroflexaceae bacterium]|nr:rod shape-determining protein MreC [Chloroflexaceae bacterium]NJL34364.1 rod shape-determining protein MreC [Chloroflexaceae bacterium]NJO06637.1 rod shape-determining protein MreC [Chloroflexaceae bacterium]
MRDFIDSSIRLREERPANASLRRPILIALLFCVLAGVLFWLDLRGMVVPVRNIFEQTSSPLAHRMLALREQQTDFWRDIIEWRQMRAENSALRQQNSQLQAELLRREQAMVENVRLRQQLAIEDQQPWDLLGAEVTIRSPDAVRRMMTIARGSRDGITEGMAVIGQTGTGPVALIGIIDSVNDYTAQVLLITDISNTLSARIYADEDTALGLVQGQWQLGSRLKLDEAERPELLKAGAIILTAGLTGELAFQVPLASVPANIPIGEVEDVRNEGSDRVASLRPYADPDQVRYVWVILNQGD